MSTDNLNEKSHQQTKTEDSPPESNSLEDVPPGESGKEPQQPSQDSRIKTLMQSRRTFAIIGAVLLVLIATASIFGGYRAGIKQRTSAEATQLTSRVKEQFDLGLQEMEANRYNLARQRFEYVIKLDPNYPGVTGKLAEVLLELNTTATPTSVPTPTITPTPDMRSIEELYAQSQQSMLDNDWSTAIETLLSLRKSDPNYQPIQVDDMLYVALRNRGKDKILVEGDLEGGIYDLSLAEKFGPLDTDAKSYLTWARMYITGASFWELDWGQAVYYFAQIAPALPNLRDGSGWTATERYRLALIGYGGYLADQKDWCGAMEQYELALTFGSDPDVEETLAFVTKKCSPPSKEQEPPQQPTESPETVPTATPTTPVVATPTQPPLPTQTPPPTPNPYPTPG